ncbi:DUF4815 domain-containing protein [Kaistia sp. MMO-174]|uniref:DUF4815 domain-containing protein n=1 Tax=Kaistia sp. MMO-174 TaxID=3081256 RepID=UPI003017C4D2
MTDFSDPSGLPAAFDRAQHKPLWQRVVGREDCFAEASDLNDIQTIVERRHRRVGDLVASDGDRIADGDIVVDVAGSSVQLAAGRVYARGDVRDVAAAVLTDVPMTGDVVIGIRIVSTVVTAVQDPDLLGLYPGSEAEGEGGSARIAETVAWGRSGDGEAGDLIAVYLLRNGTVLDQSPPPTLSGIVKVIAVYDYQAHGNYIVQGCRVTALGKSGGAQVFSIEEGIANIYGFKTTRLTALRFAQAELYDLASAQSEPHTFDDAGTGTAKILLNHAPLSALAVAMITKEVTETKVRGTPANSSDLLDKDNPRAIIEVKSGATTYAAGTDYNLSGGSISWAPAGAEPSSGQSYTVKYRYLVAVTPTAVSDTSVTLAGGVTGTDVFLTYDWKLPRIDLLCLDQDGLPVYVKGLSARSRPVEPAPAADLLPLCTVTNTWIGKPEIVNSGVRSVPYSEQWRYYNRLIDLIDMVALEKLKRTIDTKDPVAKKGMFVDPFVNDLYRDAGAAQTAAVFDGSCQLAIDPTLYSAALAVPVLLDWTEEVVIRQELATDCVLVNPYQNFNPLPISLAITPSTDFWTETSTQFLSAQTQRFGSGNTSRTTVSTNVVDHREEMIEFLRQIPVAFTVKGFGNGEILASLTFDGVDVTPAGPLVAGADGKVSGTFTIPANVTAGQKSVVATGGTGSSGSASFVGQGKIDVTVMQRVTTIQFWNVQQEVFQQTHGVDPQAQTATLDEGRHIAGVDIKFCAIGDRTKACLVEVRTVENGWPTGEVLAVAQVDMATVLVNAWTNVRFALPLYQPAGTEFAFVVKTDDPQHAIAAATMGSFDAGNQAWVSAQPYTIGVRLSSSNASTWTAHQDSDLTFRIVAAKFNPVTKAVNLGSFALVDCSDLIVSAGVLLPTAETSLYFEVERASGEIIKLLSDQVYEFIEYVTETVKLRAILKGSAKASPILFPGVQLLAGKLRGTGTYISRAMKMGTAVRVMTNLATKLPAGSTLKVEHDAGDNNWVEATFLAQSVLEEGWIEREYKKDPYSATKGRIRLTLTGSPAARPSLADLRSWSV